MQLCKASALICSIHTLPTVASTPGFTSIVSIRDMLARCVRVKIDEARN